MISRARRDIQADRVSANREARARRGCVYLLASAAGNSARISQFGAPIEIGAGLGIRPSPRVNVTVLPTVGLSNASPKYAPTFGFSGELMPR
jgi:hypothetical protein